MKFDRSIVQTTFQSPLGKMIIAATDKGLAGLWFEGQRHMPLELAELDHRAPRRAAPSKHSPLGGQRITRSEKRGGQTHWPTQPDHPALKQTIQQLTEYFAGRRTSFDVPLDLAYGTAFQQSVWQALLAIPQGGTLSYSEVSGSIGKPAAVRAVGAAVGRNPVSIIVPCHRVLGTNGSLTGYAGGLDRKTALLKLEGVL
ncbi:methylated-DNA--[protein]-cysteine S-methyltransferase [Polaromonas sp.]|uniref:methylated-DNA--[protein]-cysteine S-methyltransferase n=1 Tax=Polaromonas sp. TaxID=1869339 RepID=UPI002FC61837